MSIEEYRQSSGIREKLEAKFADPTEELRGLTRLILTFAPEFFAEVNGIAFQIFFTKKPLQDHAGYCKRLESATRFKLKTDFFIIIDQALFDSLNRIDKAKLVIHELHHISKDEKGEPTIRKHNEKENFCELPSHDIFSETVVEKLRDRLTQPALIEAR